MYKKAVSIFLLCLPLLCFAQNRKALVISNYDYYSNPIESGQKDGDDVAALLKSMDFETTYATNLNQRKLVSTIKNFSSSVSVGGTKPDLILFYYRGFAVQVEGKNYLLPAGTDVLSEQDIKLLGLSLDDVLERLYTIKAKDYLIFIDACDQNPWQSLVTKSKPGLAYTELSPEHETILMFSQSLNKNALSWADENSLFTKHFLSEFNNYYKDFRILCSDISAAVKKNSGSNQIPWINSTIVDEAYIIPRFFPKSQSDGEEDDEDYSYDFNNSSSDSTFQVTYVEPADTGNVHPFKYVDYKYDYNNLKIIYDWATSMDRREKIYTYLWMPDEETFDKWRLKNGKKIYISSGGSNTSYFFTDGNWTSASFFAPIVCSSDGLKVTAEHYLSIDAGNNWERDFGFSEKPSVYAPRSSLAMSKDGSLVMYFDSDRNFIYTYDFTED